jgi:3,4-dihydroxy 2-butanone 4-phosphate synthase/GTP cyclohydrolase II
MKFADWIKQQGFSQIEVGHQLGISQGHVSDLCAGRFWPSRAVALKILRLTGGAVTPNDFLSDEERAEISGMKLAVARNTDSRTMRLGRERKTKG